MEVIGKPVEKWLQGGSRRGGGWRVGDEMNCA
jgi:hypothetical protein